MSNAYKIVDVLLPLAIPRVYSYKLAPEFHHNLRMGIRVEVPLRNKLYSGILLGESTEPPQTLAKLREVISLIDQVPIISDLQYKLWSWIAEYYLCTLGEVMNIALPAGLKLSSETKLIVRSHVDDYEGELNEKEYLLAEAISMQEELTIARVQEILEQKTVYPFIKSLLDKNIIFIKEELKSGYKPKKEDYLRSVVDLQDPKQVEAAFDLLKRSDKQTRALLSYSQLVKTGEWVAKKAIYAHADVDSATIKALVKKELIEVEAREVSRMGMAPDEVRDLPPLNEHQKIAKQEIDDLLLEQDKVLLFGVTGSGKTRIYIDLIKETLAQGKQVLYLLPEIALTTQIVSRLIGLFAEQIGVYHSRMSNNQRVELWKSTLNGQSLILGARSSIFLPFQNLGLIIIDEEHDPSYKQTDPAPRYNARDTAMLLASLHGAKVLMGTATPSLETYMNTISGKYGLVKLLHRHGESELPVIDIIDLREQHKKKLMQSLFSKEVKDAIDAALIKKEQVLIFQNRRGYSPTLQCKLCDFHAECPNCDVSLTVHHYFNELRCHYCGYRHKLPSDCPQCGHNGLDKLGFGTEKIEDEIKLVFPTAKVARLDFDTAKTKNAYEQILSNFAEQKVDILVGTQMITKGLDFDNIAIVCVLAADKILYFPDFKANERAYQLFTQVAGRAGRRKKKGRVMIQTYNPDHPVIVETSRYDHATFYKRELAERKKFIYPPFFRMIKISIKHKKPEVASDAAALMTNKLRAKFGNRIYGPTIPGISRLRGYYIQNIMIKMEKKREQVAIIKQFVRQLRSTILDSDGYKSLRIILDVDP